MTKNMGSSWMPFEDSSKSFKSWSALAGATMERSIPHIRSIFSTPSSRKKSSSSDTQDLCQQYDQSPRHNRTKAPPTKQQQTPPTKQQQQQQAPPSKSRRSNYNTYTSKTQLTEKDMRHLERHLSMKKTIRKQISRNLAQAFLDNPDIFEPDSSDKSDHQLEQNVLDLLKVSIEDRDSGHSSPALEDTDDDEDQWRSSSRGETKGLMADDRSNNKQEEKKSSSIWRMFSSRNKAKR